MKFAEMTQEVHIARSNPVKLELGFTPGRRQANKVTAVAQIIFYNCGIYTRMCEYKFYYSQIFREARSKLEKEGRLEAADLNIDLGLVYRYCNNLNNLNSLLPFLFLFFS